MITIEKVSLKTRAMLEAFLWEQCEMHYGEKITHERYNVLKKRLHKECENPHNALFIARNEHDRIVGSIALSAYDHRIETLKHYYTHHDNIAEVSRCYVDARYRRQGIGGMLFDHAQRFAKECGYETLYLHTHYFLPGGFYFWKKMGFEISIDEHDSWQTVHMERLVGAVSCCA